MTELLGKHRPGQQWKGKETGARLGQAGPDPVAPQLLSARVHTSSVNKTALKNLKTQLVRLLHAALSPSL